MLLPPGHGNGSSKCAWTTVVVRLIRVQLSRISQHWGELAMRRIRLALSAAVVLPAMGSLSLNTSCSTARARRNRNGLPLGTITFESRSTGNSRTLAGILQPAPIAASQTVLIVLSCRKGTRCSKVLTIRSMQRAETCAKRANEVTAPQERAEWLSLRGRYLALAHGIERGKQGGDVRVFPRSRVVFARNRL